MSADDTSGAGQLPEAAGTAPAPAGWTQAGFLPKTRHDLRTPLNAVLGYGEMLLEDAEADGDAGLAARIEQVRGEGAGLLARIDALLDPVMLDATGPEVSPGALAEYITSEFEAPVAALAASADALVAAVGAGAEGVLADAERIRTASRALQGLVRRGVAPAGPPVPVLPPTPYEGYAPVSGGWSMPGNILVVDDVELNRDLLGRHLERQGHTVATAEGGRRALEMLAEGDFDVVLLDVMMPEVDGFEVLERIKLDDRLRHVRVVMLSALDQTDSVARCIEMGADDYLSKPFNPVLLKARIGACLERRRWRQREAEHLRNLAAAREAEHRRKTEELEFARKMQLSLLPPGDVRGDGIEMVGRMATATEVGGDYYDFVPLEGGRHLVAVGDATGHGVAAGMIVGMTKMGLLTGLQAVDDAESLGRLVAELNGALRRCMTQRGIGMALALAIFDPATGAVTVSSNGIPSPFHYRAREGALEPLDLKAPPLGFLRTVPVPTRRLELLPGDSLVFLTDGFAERFDHAGEQWGYATVERELARICRAGVGAEAIASRVVSACDDFAGGRETDDDMTVVVVTATPR